MSSPCSVNTSRHPAASYRSLVDLLAQYHFAAVFLYFLLLEALTFGEILPRIGFYLDDWNMVSQLYFGPQQLWSMIGTYFLGDPKIIVRPVEVPHFISMFWLFRLEPIGYHLTNAFMEVVTVWLAYVVLYRLSDSRMLSLLAGIVFLLYPIHDSTHYWIVASSATLSLMLYMVSLWCNIEGAARANRTLMAVGYLCFALSIFNYECYLPLFPFSVACALYVTADRKRFVARGFLQSIPYVLAIAAVFAYGRWLVPLLGTAWVHGAEINPANIFRTVVRGVQVSITAEPFQFLGDRLVRDGVWSRPRAWLAIVPACVCGCILLAAFAKEQVSRKKVLLMAFAGFVVVLLSYTIFGLNSEYEPTLSTFVNRINYAAALGAGMLFAAIVLLVGTTRSGKFQQVFLSIALVGFVLFSILGNWAMSRPWTLSWVMQKHVRQVVLDNRTAFKSNDTIMLLNSPRYVMWSPVFDGAWDFQNMVRLTLNDSTINGGVVSERLSVKPGCVVDVSHNYVCATYPFAGMRALVATDSQVVPIHNASDFVDVVSRRGMAFDLDSGMPAKWRSQMQIAAKEAVMR